VDLNVGEAARARWSLRSLGSALRRSPTLQDAVAVVTAAVAALTFILASGIDLRAGRPLAFAYLFRRNEPAAAVLSCLLVAGAWIGARWLAPGTVEATIGRLTQRPRTFIVAVTGVLALAAVLVYRAHPLSMDEYAPLFQAGIFARGKLKASVAPELLPRLVPQGRWFLEAAPSGEIISGYWPGFALLLTPFTWLRCPWLLNPLIGGASLWVLWWLSHRLFPGTRAPGWAILIAASSPAFTVNAISFYSMPAHLLASLGFVALLQDPKPSRLLAAGALGSLAATLHNPLPHALFALPFIVALARRSGFRRLLILAAGYLPGLLLLGAGWLQVRAQIGRAPEVAQGSAGLLYQLRLAFAAPSLDAVWIRGVNLVELALWATPVLLPLACAGAMRAWRSESVRLLVWSALLTLVAYVFVPYDQGHGWGYRYFHSAWGVLPLLAAGALELPPAGAPEVSSSGGSLRNFAFAASIAGLIFANGLRFFQVRSFVDAQLAQIPQARAPGKLEVVFLRLDRGYYTVDLVQNDPFLEGGRWILISFGRAEDERFMRRSFPGARLAASSEIGSTWQIE
jgi:hypothetical protein